MSKVFQLATLAGALTLAMSSASALNLTYEGWTVAGGSIDINGKDSICKQTNVSCSVVASGEGFTQVNVSDLNDTTSGESYIMTIVTDQNAGGGANGTGSIGPGSADLGFYDVSFVKMKLTLGGTGTNGNQNGITAHQSIKDTTGGGEFTSTSDINTGWALGTTPITISQTLTDPGSDTVATGDDFSSGFLYRSENSKVDDGTGTLVDSGIRSGFEMSIDQTAGLASGTNLATDPSRNDIQVFALREKQGSLLKSPSVGTGLNLSDAPGTITWAPGDDIKAIWIGQKINLGDSAQAAGNLGSAFGYLSFQNTTAGANPVKTVESSFGFDDSKASNPWVWDTAFNMKKATGDVQLGTPCIADATGEMADPAVPGDTSVCTQLP